MMLNYHSYYFIYNYINNTQFRIISLLNILYYILFYSLAKNNYVFTCKNLTNNITLLNTAHRQQADAKKTTILCYLVR